MSAPAAPVRRPVTTVRPQDDRPRVPYRGLFREAVYEDGQPYGRHETPDDET